VRARTSTGACAGALPYRCSRAHSPPPARGCPASTLARVVAQGEDEPKAALPARPPAPAKQKFWPAKADLPPRRPDPEPLEDYDVPLIIFGTALWVIAGVVLFAMHDRLEEHDKGWWPYSTIVGAALGLWGIRLVRRRRARRRARAAAATKDPTA
jgi:hypothetical protein